MADNTMLFYTFEKRGKRNEIKKFFLKLLRKPRIFYRKSILWLTFCLEGKNISDKDKSGSETI